MSRRTPGEGTIYKRSDGRWVAQISVLDGQGRRKRPKRVCRSQAGARKALQRLRDEHFGGVYQSEGDQTTGEFLDYWLRVDVEPHSESSTVENYRVCIGHMRPLIGRVRLKSLRPSHVSGMLLSLTEKHAERLEAERRATSAHNRRKGVRRRKGPAETSGERTRQNVYVVLRTALARAVELGWIPNNPCDRVKKPRVRPAEIFPFTLAESRLILDSTAGTRIHAICALGLLCGMRIGEILGLDREDVDLENATLLVRQQLVETGGRVELRPPKWGSRRLLRLPSVVCDALAEHLAILLREGHGGNEHVFCAAKGGPLRRGNFRTRQWNPLLRRLRLKHRGFHHTRHTYATISIAEGVPLTEVSKTLGHKKLSTTADTYSHWLAEYAERSATIIDNLYRRRA